MGGSTLSPGSLRRAGWLVAALALSLVFGLAQDASAAQLPTAGQLAPATEGTLSSADGAPPGLAAATVKVGTSPVAVLSGVGGIWVANAGSDSVTQIDPATLQVLATVQLGSSPSSLAASEGDLFVGSETTNSVTEISETTAQVVATLQIGTPGEAPLLVASGPVSSVTVASGTDGSLWWISSGGTVSKPASIGGTPAGLTVPTDEPSQVWATDPSTNNVRFLKNASPATVHTVGVGAGPQGIAFDLSSQTILVANEGDGTISEISPSTDTVTSTVSAGVPKGGQFAIAASPSRTDEVDPRKGFIWVANTAAGTLDAVSETTGRTTITVPVGAGPDALAVSYPGIWVANKTDGTVTDVSLPVVSGPGPATYNVGDAVNLQLGVSPYPPVTLSAGLPNDLTLSPSGLISGTLQEGGLFDVDVQASNVLGPGQDTFVVITVDAPPSAGQTIPPVFAAGQAGTEEVGYLLGYPAPTVAETGALPSGLTVSCTPLSSASAATSCVMSGTPAANTGGTYPFTLTGSNGLGSPASEQLVLTVDQAPVFLSRAHVTFRRGKRVTFTVRTRAVPVAQLAASGRLPHGLRLKILANGDAVISGTVARSVRDHARYKITFRAVNWVDGQQTVTQVLRITIG